MSEFNEAIIESLSSKLVGERHLLSECTVLKIPAFISEWNDIIVWVFVRKCVCKLQHNAASDINYDEVRVPKTGFEIHRNDNCDIYMNYDFENNCYTIERRCYCRQESRSYNR